MAVRVSGLRHGYGSRVVLDGLELNLAAGANVAVMGKSGAGKTTFLSLMGGLEPIQSGSIEVAGQALERLPPKALAQYRRTTVGFVFQHFGLLDSMTALENVELALALGGTPRNRRRSVATELLEQVGLADQLHEAPPALSGGERQRAAIARALANRPRLLLADEPTGNLDEDTAAQVLDVLDNLRAATGCTMVVVTHEQDVAARADHRIVLRRGRLGIQA